MGYRSTKRVELSKRRKEVATLYLRGVTQWEIAEQMDVNQATISRDLKALQEEWLQSALVDINEAKAKELAKIDALEIEYYQAWERSQEDAETIINEKIGTQKGESLDKRGKEVRKLVGQSGDPRFLQGVQWCINKRCEILGLDSPKKTELSSDGEPIIIEVVREGESKSSSA